MIGCNQMGRQKQQMLGSSHRNSSSRHLVECRMREAQSAVAGALGLTPPCHSSCWQTRHVYAPSFVAWPCCTIALITCLVCCGDTVFVQLSSCRCSRLCLSATCVCFLQAPDPAQALAVALDNEAQLSQLTAQASANTFMLRA
jgi:hypothetical protein